MSVSVRTVFVVPISKDDVLETPLEQAPNSGPVLRQCHDMTMHKVDLEHSMDVEQILACHFS